MSIGFSLVPSSAAASAVFVEQENIRRGVGSALPHKVLLIGQFNTGSTPTANVPQLLQDVADAQTRYGRGSMLAIMAARAFASGAIGYDVYALPVADAGAGADATADIVVVGPATGSGTLAFTIAGVEVDIAVASGASADTVGDAIEAAINGNLDLPVTASNTSGTVTVTAKNAGTVGNQIRIYLNRNVGDATPAGLTMTVPATLASGATDPVLTTALGGLDSTWYTEVVCPYLGDTEISLVEATAEDRMDPGTKRPFLAFIGWGGTRADLLTALGAAGSRTRNSEFSVYVPVYGTPTPDFEIGASFAGMWARHHASDKVGRPVVGNRLPGIIAGTANELTYSLRDGGVKLGASYTTNAGSSVLAGDTVSTRIETDAGVATDSWRFAVIVPNLQYKINSADITFGSAPFQQAVVISDSVAAAPAFAVRPKTAKAYAIALVDDWVGKGLTADRDTVVDGVVAELDSSNPGRINVMIPDIPSAGLRILAAKIEWDFLV